VVDEALAVGDEVFQRKCFSRIHEIQKEGATILFVSHAAQAVMELCSEAILIDQGELLLSGAPKLVVSRYHKLIYAPEDKVASLREDIRVLNAHIIKPSLGYEASEGDGAIQMIAKEPSASAFYDSNLVSKSTISYEMRGAKIEDVRITVGDGKVVNVLNKRQEYIYTYSVEFLETCFNVRFGMLIKTITGFGLGGAASSTTYNAIDCIEVGTKARVKFRFMCLLQPGVYFLNAGVLGTINGNEVYLHRIIDVAMFRVQSEGNLISTEIVDFYADPSVSLE